MVLTGKSSEIMGGLADKKKGENITVSTDSRLTVAKAAHFTRHDIEEFGAEHKISREANHRARACVPGRITRQSQSDALRKEGT